MVKQQNQKNSSKTVSELYTEAQRLAGEQDALIGGVNTNQHYQDMLASYVGAKLSQVEAIEDKLEFLADREKAKLQTLGKNAPGLLSKPSTRKAWHSAQANQQARLQQLTERLTAVREIKEGMGLHSSKIEELAIRKLRSENPELVSDWNYMKETERVREALLKDRKIGGKKLSVGLSHTLD